MHQAKILLTYAYSWGYLKSAKEGDISPTVIVFKPLENIPTTSKNPNSESDERKIPTNRIIGTFRLPNRQEADPLLNKSELREVMTGIRNVIKKHQTTSIKDSGESPQL